MIEISRNMNEGALDTLAIAGLSLATGYALVSTGKLIHDTVKRKKYIKIAKEYYKITNPDFNIADCSSMALSQDDIKEMMGDQYDENCIYVGKMFIKNGGSRTLTMDDLLASVITRYNRVSKNVGIKEDDSDNFVILHSAKKSKLTDKEMQNIFLLLSGFVSPDIESTINNMERELLIMQGKKAIKESTYDSLLDDIINS